MKLLSASIQFFRISFQDFKCIVLFLLSVIFFMIVFQDLTWFPDELNGHWIIKRFISASFFSLGYLFQYSLFKNRFKKISKIAIGTTMLISALLALILGFNVRVVFLLILGLLFLKVRENELA